MTQVEFYSEAQSDASFREQQMEDAAYQKNMAKTFFGLGVIATVVYAAYCWFDQHRLPDFGSLGLLVVLCSSSYAHACTKLGALEAINAASKVTQPRLQRP